MGLMQRVERAQQGANGNAHLIPVIAPPSLPTPATTPEREALLRSARMALQGEVVRAFDALIDIPPEEATKKIEELVDRVLGSSGFALTRSEREKLIAETVNDVTGLGPLETLLKDQTITEVMVNGPNQIYIERAGKILRVDTHFLNNEHVLRIIDRIITPLGRRIDDTSPRVDARLADGSRVNAIIAPLSLIGPVITVRKFSAKPFTVEDLIGFGTATAEMFEFLEACVKAKLNVFVSGGTGSGKTTTLNVISSFIPNDERIVTIEDAAELQLRQEHVVTLEARPPNLEGEGEITIRNLLRNAMHMRPDRIIVGECRAGEALDMLQAMTTGHDGSLSTGHANTPKDMLRRLETMILMTGYEMPLWAIREQIASAVDLIVHTARLKDGSRKIVNITEVFGIEDEEILTQDIFAFEQTGLVEGKVQGELKPTGFRPTFMGQFKRNGVPLPPGEFGIPTAEDARPMPRRKLKERWGGANAAQGPDPSGISVGHGRAKAAGGMLYVSAIGPVDRATGMTVPGGIKDQARSCLTNLKTVLEEQGSSLEKVVWANWSLYDRSEFDTFYEEWLAWFPGIAPVGQGTLMPPPERRAGFRVSIGVIAEAGGA
jgi:pilus assembly protein CpaF